MQHLDYVVPAFNITLVPKQAISIPGDFKITRAVYWAAPLMRNKSDNLLVLTRDAKRVGWLNRANSFVEAPDLDPVYFETALKHLIKPSFSPFYSYKLGVQQGVLDKFAQGQLSFNKYPKKKFKNIAIVTLDGNLFFKIPNTNIDQVLDSKYLKSLDQIREFILENANEFDNQNNMPCTNFCEDCELFEVKDFMFGPRA